MKLVKKNQKLHNPDSPLLIGDVNEDAVKEVIEHSFMDLQQNYFKLKYIKLYYFPPSRLISKII